MKGEWRSATLVLSLAAALIGWATKPLADGDARARLERAAGLDGS